MPVRVIPLQNIFVLGIAILLLLVVGCSGARVGVTPALEVIPTATTAVSGMALPAEPQESWVLLNGPPEDATQVEIGAEIYRLVCSTCHGDVGQGLTDEWRARVDPENQNCWQSKCHVSNHPPDGFVLPRDIPSVTGERVAARFSNALNLYQFVSVTMPYHVPGTMLDEEYWQVTAFLLALNGIEMGDTVLDASNAAEVLLQP